MSELSLTAEQIEGIIKAINEVSEFLKEVAKVIYDFCRDMAEWFSSAWRKYMRFKARLAPSKWRHYALHSKRKRIRKKYLNRILTC